MTLGDLVSQLNVAYDSDREEDTPALCIAYLQGMSGDYGKDGDIITALLNVIEELIER